MGSEKSSEPTIADIIRSLIAQFELVNQDIPAIENNCQLLLSKITFPLSRDDTLILQPLLALPARKSGKALQPLFIFFEQLLSKGAEPLPILETMYSAREGELVKRALDVTVQHIEKGMIVFNRAILLLLAEAVGKENSPLSDPLSLQKIKFILSSYQPSGKARPSKDPIQWLYLHDPDRCARQLAAKILDDEKKPLTKSIVNRLFKEQAANVLSPYLEFTGARYTDLLYLLQTPGQVPVLIESLRNAETICGRKRLCDVISALGWSGINYGLQVEPYTAVSVSGSLPLILNPAEAALFEKCGQTRREAEYVLVVAHGGENGTPASGHEGNQVINRFRTYNLLHAELLSEILDIAPLTSKRVHHILRQMEKVVDDYTFLFREYSPEYSILPSLFEDLKRKIQIELDKEKNSHQLSTELTRLVQMFEDPRSLAEVQTLHGLKRYLHQQGLKLGFRFVEAGKSPKRTIKLILANEKQIIQKISRIAYADFEHSKEDADRHAIPFAVDVVVQAYARQMFYGQESFPHVDIFCYGNEVHYYLSYRNHPAFLRIDYSPPLRGGMIDLEFFGVSNYELSLHPNITLDYIRYFFQKMDFDIHIESTHIHARYDKERSIDLASLCDKAAALFRLVPYLMDIDWVIGSLSLSAEAKRKVAEAWAESFILWGVLPLQRLLSKDRHHIIEKIVSSPAGKQEIFWQGNGPYSDQFTIKPPLAFFNKLNQELRRLGMDLIPPLQSDLLRPMGHIHLEKRWLNPLREMVKRGEIVPEQRGFQRRSSDLFERLHECLTFVDILNKGSEEISRAVAVARLIRPLEKTLRFQTTGFIEGLEVQKTYLSLKSKFLVIFVLRGMAGIIRLAFYAHDSVLYRYRKDRSKPWQDNASLDVLALNSLLRSENYSVAGPESLSVVDPEELDKITTALHRAKPLRRPAPLPGEKLINGLKAAPGRSIGRVIFGTEGRSAQDYKGCIIVAASIRPQDNTTIYHASGVVSTGGGILSHAGLLAIQFNKPALIIDGRWVKSGDGTCRLFFMSTHYDEKIQRIDPCEVITYHNIREHEYCLHEGDLVILDAREGMIRVLGQEHDTLALHDGFRQFDEANRLLITVSSQREILHLRGRRLRARHQIERILVRLNDPIVAQYAVQEILSTEGRTGYESKPAEKAYLLKLLIENRPVSQAVQACILRTFDELGHRFNNRREKGLQLIPTSIHVWEILQLRLEIFSLQQTLCHVREAIAACAIQILPAVSHTDVTEIDQMALKRIRLLHKKHLLALKEIIKHRQFAIQRHLLRQIQRVDELLKQGTSQAILVQKALSNLEEQDQQTNLRLGDRPVIRSSEGGFEIFPLIGWKAANLAEVQRLGAEDYVPPWFVVTDRAFQQVLDKPFRTAATGTASKSLRSAIEGVLERQDINDFQKSAKIKKLWNDLILPENLTTEVNDAYQWMKQEIGDAGPQGHDEPFVAIRSSSREEDAESAARAGEFETFLFIRGQVQLLEYLKRTWASLWTERAIHNRKILGSGSGQTGGGVLIQKIVWARVAGVMQTVNIARGELREMVINAGLGMGEGIVSGLVGADQITISREGDPETDALKFSYITNDKKQQIVFDKRLGAGTMLADTLYHQRFRAALEYIEIQELVRLANRLEEAYGYPLDIEFAFEGTKLWILQVRPVATFLSTYQMTLERYPLTVQ